MRSKVFGAILAFVLCAGVVLVSAGGDDDGAIGPDVVILTKDNFDSIVDSQELMLVSFTAPWCGHCKSMKPAYSEAATILKKNSPPILLGNVDATKDSELARRFEVNGYPTLKVFRNGKPSEYKGQRSKEAFVTTMKKSVGPSAKPVADRAACDALVNANSAYGYVVVGVFKPRSESQLASAFQFAADRMRDGVTFALVSDTSKAAQFGLAADSEGIVALKSFDGAKPAVYAGSSKTKELEEWINKEGVPLVGQFAESTEQIYRAQNLPLMKVFLAVDWKQKTQMNYIVNRVKKAAEAHKGALQVALVNGKDYQRDADLYHYKDGKDVVVVIEHNNKKYKMDAKFSAAAVDKFAADFIAGGLEEYVRSEPEPDKNDGPVRVVTGKTIKSFVNDEDDVMLEFYAPWCGHCKTLEPKYVELGEKVRSKLGSARVRIGKLDATANDFPRDKFEVSGYPTVYFKPAGAAKPILYKGPREVNDMFKFIKENGKTLKE